MFSIKFLLFSQTHWTDGRPVGYTPPSTVYTDRNYDKTDNSALSETIKNHVQSFREHQQGSTKMKTTDNYDNVLRDAISDSRKSRLEMKKGCILLMWSPLMTTPEWLPIDCNTKLSLPLTVCYVGSSNQPYLDVHSSIAVVYVDEFPTTPSAINPYYLYHPDYPFGDRTLIWGKANTRLIHAEVKQCTRTVAVFCQYTWLCQSPWLQANQTAHGVLRFVQDACDDVLPNRWRALAYILYSGGTNHTEGATIAWTPDKPLQLCAIGQAAIGDFCLSVTKVTATEKRGHHEVKDIIGNLTVEDLKPVVHYTVNSLSFLMADERIVFDITISRRSIVMFSCPQHLYQCEDYACIHHKYVLDGHQNCEDGSDEDRNNLVYIKSSEGSNTDVFVRRKSPLSPVFSQNQVSSSSVYFHCVQSDLYINYLLTCDGKCDCHDCMDETVCIMSKIPFQTPLTPSLRYVTTASDCKGNFCNHSHICVDFNLVDDLVADCPMAEDEPILAEILSSALTGGNITRKAQACLLGNRLPCSLGHPKCFPIHGLCVYNLDYWGYLKYCRNGVHLFACESVRCPLHFKCGRSYCVPIRMVCDGSLDCPGGEDEGQCDGWTSACSGGFLCKSGECLHLADLCDGYSDCRLLGDDEYRCNDPCPRHCTCRGFELDCRHSTESSLDDLESDLSIYKLISLRRCLTQVPDLVTANEVLVLNLEGNDIQKISDNNFKSVWQLVVLDISNNLISEIPEMGFLALDNLQSLILRSNPLTGGIQSLKWLQRLEYLDISHCNLMSMPTALFHSSCPLRAVDMSSTAITMMDFATFPYHDKDLTLNMVNMTKLTNVDNVGGLADVTVNVTIRTDQPLLCCVARQYSSCVLEGDDAAWCGPVQDQVHAYVLLTHSLVLCLFILALLPLHWRHRYRIWLEWLAGLILLLGKSWFALQLLLLYLTESVFDYSSLRSRDTPYSICFGAALMQMLGYFTLCSLLPTVAFAMKENVKIVSEWTRWPSVKLITFLMLIVCVIVISVVIFGQFACPVGEMCTFIGDIQCPEAPLYIIIPINMLLYGVAFIGLTVSFYAKAAMSIRTSAKAVLLAGGTRSGHSVKPSIIVTHFMLHVLVPICVIFTLQIDSVSQGHLSKFTLHIVPTLLSAKLAIQIKRHLAGTKRDVVKQQKLGAKSN